MYFKTTLDSDITYLLQEIGHNCLVDNIPAKAIVNNIDRDNNYDDKRIITHEPINRGSYIYYADKYFLVMDNVNDSRYNIYYKGSMRLCNFDIKFILNNKLYLFYSAIDGNKFTIQGDKVIEMSADTITVILPATQVTRLVTTGISFIKWNRKFTVEGVDFTKNGLVALQCKLIANNDSTDDMENEIADRYKSDIDALDGNITPIMPFDTFFSITIDNPIEILSLDEAYQLIVIAKDDDMVVENPVLHYHSSFEEVATVSNTGLITAIAEGVTTITVTFMDRQAVMALTVEEVEQLPTYELTGNGQLRNGQTGQYTIIKKIGGVNVGGSFTFKLSDTTLASFVEQADDNCRVKANTSKLGFVTLTATDTDNDEQITKQIEIISFM